MADEVFSIPSEAPPITSSSLDGDQDLKAAFEENWRQVDEAEAARASQEPPQPPEPPVAKISEKDIEDAAAEEKTPVEVATPEKRSRRKLSESTRAPSPADLDEDLDGPKEVAAKTESPVTIAKPGEPDIDSLEPHPASNAEGKSHFKQLKEAAKSFREKAHAYEAKLGPLAQELGIPVDDIDSLVNHVRQLKSQPQLAPQDAQELAYFRGRDVLKGLVNSPTFQKEYQQPLETTYDSVLEQICKFLPGDPEGNKKTWLQPLKTEFRPTSQRYGEITEDWWRNTIGAMQCDGLTKQSVFNEVVKLKGLEQKYKDTALKIATNPESLEELRRDDQKAYQAENEKFAKQYADMVRDEVEKELKIPELKYFHGIREKEPEKFAKIENEFQAVLKDFNTGPRAAAKRAVEFMHLKEQVAELKRVKAENERLRKSVGLTRRVQDAPLRRSSCDPSCRLFPRYCCGSWTRPAAEPHQTRTGRQPPGKSSEWDRRLEFAFRLPSCLKAIGTMPIISDVACLKSHSE
jgi:hypothetical protein